MAAMMVGTGRLVMLLGGLQAATQCLWPRPPTTGGGHWNLGTLLALHRLRISDTWQLETGRPGHQSAPQV